MKIKLNKFVLVAFLTLLTIQMLIVWIFGKFSMSEFGRQEEESMDYILKMCSWNLNGALAKADSDLVDILSNQSTLLLLKNKSDLQRWRASYSLLEFLKEKQQPVSEVDGYVILDTEFQGFIMSRSNHIDYESLKYIKTYFNEHAKEKVNNTGWISAQIGGRVYLLKCYNYGGVCIAALISEQNIRQLMSYGQDTHKLLEFYVTDSNSRIICSSDSDRRYGDSLLKETGRAGFTSIWYEREVREGEYRVVAKIQHLGILWESPYFFIVLVMLLVSLVFMFWFLHLINHEIVRPIHVLSHTSERIRGGDLSIRPVFSCKNAEMEGLREAYVTMLDTIMKLKLQEYENVIHMKESELKYMQMQLKPHFFLNALSTINSMAYQNNHDKIHEFIQVFSKNIRYMFRVGLHTVSLEEEISNVEEYLEMQRLLYKNIFYAYLEVPEEMKNWQIPQMLLHTFVENIFKHAMDLDSFTTIFINCSAKEYHGQTMLKIEIQNSGKLFDMEILDRINGDKGNAGDGKGGIGLVHTKEILSIMYGWKDLLYLENEEQAGTKVTVWIPEMMQMKMRDTV